MFSNYFKTALRNLLRQKSSTFINLSGLTLGITCSLILFLMISYMSSFDTFHSKRDRIFRVVNQSDGNQGKFYTAGVPAVLPDAFRNDFHEVEEVVFTSYRANSLVTISQPNGELNKYQEERGVVFTEPSFFKIFDRNILMGDATKGLDDPNEAIISRDWAIKYFGKEDVIGEVVRFDNKEYRITALVEDAPTNSDLPFNLMLSYATIKKEREELGWSHIWSDEQCYFLLKEGEHIGRVESRMAAFSKKYLGDDNYNRAEFLIQPFSQVHFDERFSNYSYNTVSKGMLTALVVIALVLIITACINFINLTTAEAIKRSKEVGVRKSLGSSRAQLVWQFMGETIVVTLFAVVVSLGLTQLALSFLNPFLNVKLTLDFTQNQYLWIYLAGVTLLVSVLSGLYPSFIISGFKPALALKNQITNKNSSGYTLRRALVIVQFCISQLFIIGTIVIIKQINYFQSKDLGFTKDAILVVPIPEEESYTANKERGGLSKMRTLRDEVLRIRGVEEASLASSPPSSGNVQGTNLKVIGHDEEYGIQLKQIDGRYLDLYKLELVVGNNLNDYDTMNGFLVNEKLVRIIGISDPTEILGKVIRVWGKEFPVTGVVKDFHTVSLRSPIEATVLFNRIKGFNTLSVKVDVQRTQQVIADLKAKWEATYPEHLFEYTFLDEQIRSFYERDQKMSVLISIFTSMAIFIGCLGLFGLATFMTNQKTKEIGVRKVLGASVESIVLMFSKEYMKLIVIGFIFAVPLAWFVANQFLSEFVYKIELGPVYFLSGLGLTLLIAVLTVGYKSFKSAITNPVKSLRYE